MCTYAKKKYKYRFITVEIAKKWRQFKCLTTKQWIKSYDHKTDFSNKNGQTSVIHHHASCKAYWGGKESKHHDAYRTVAQNLLKNAHVCILLGRVFYRWYLVGFRLSFQPSISLLITLSSCSTYY